MDTSEIVFDHIIERGCGLDVHKKEIVAITELEGFSFKEISETTGIGINTLISRKRYAVLHLRKQLFELYEDILSI